MISQIVVQPVRMDAAGDGRFGAARGERTHRGVDYICVPDAVVLCPVDGYISKHGIAYRDDHSYSYVEVTDAEGFRHRMFYVTPTEPIGKEVERGEAVGRAQNISDRYPGTEMLPHVHYEIKDGAGKHLDVDHFFEQRNIT